MCMFWLWVIQMVEIINMGQKKCHEEFTKQWLKFSFIKLVDLSH